MKNVLWLGLLGAVACGNKDDDETSGTPTDSDSGGGGSTEPVTDPSYTGLTGTVTYTSQLDGETQCSATVELTGTPFTGPCPSCLFAFEITSDITVSPEDCPLDAITTWTESAALTNPVLAYSLAHDEFIPYNARLDNVLWYGFQYSDSYYYYVDPELRYWIPVADDAVQETAYSTAVNTAPVWDGDTLTWTISREVELFEPNPDGGTFCYDQYISAYAGESGLNQATVQESLLIGAYGDSSFDVYTFDAAAEDSVAISVNTVDAESAFSPWISVLDEDGCIIASMFGTFECAFSDPNAYFSTFCPSMSFVAPATGQYRIVVHGISFYGYLTGGQVEEGRYRLDIDNPGGPATLLQDDAPNNLGPFVQTAVTTLEATIARE